MAAAPPTRLYFRRTWQLLFRSGHFLEYFTRFCREMFVNIGVQRFIYPRGRSRWIGHFMLATGCMLAFAITIPLTLGWIYFTMDAAHSINATGAKYYEAYVFGFKVMGFPLGSLWASLIFNALSWCSLLVIFGVFIFLKRRVTKGGLIASQSFGGDLLPLLLLLTVAVTGLGITLDYHYLKGISYNFMTITHAIAVIMFLIWIPFGKFFHIIQRPAQIGVHIYRQEGERRGMAVCPHTGKAFTTQMHVEDLKQVTKELGFDFTLEDGTSHLDLSPEGKRDALATAHLKARNAGGHLFG
ncbi:hypothetical protein [Chitinophaga agrisoli]|uniref:hypothetical protein n=1 Tax=Chitinophaga agrisoli TaxID=2607653 RepID=UPI001BC8F0F7|nr:hypothetical protein [Chitinophaga agrisoli]